MTRTALINAYQKTTGHRGISASSKERQNGAEIPGVVAIGINQREIDRYDEHGLAKIKIPVGNFAQVAFIIDTDPLKKLSTIQETWLKQAPETLTLYISCGVQIAKENASGIRLDRALEGLLLRTVALSRTATPANYKAEVIPLYGERLY